MLATVCWLARLLLTLMNTVDAQFRLILQSSQKLNEKLNENHPCPFTPR